MRQIECVMGRLEEDNLTFDFNPDKLLSRYISRFMSNVYVSTYLDMSLVRYRPDPCIIIYVCISIPHTAYCILYSVILHFSEESILLNALL